MAPARHDRPRRGALRIAIALVLVAAASWWPLRSAGPALVVNKDVGAPDAIVMLASHEWERLPATAAIARKYPNAVVLLTMPRVVTPYNCYRCGERVSWLGSEGVYVNRVRVLSQHVGNTHDEALASLNYARQQGVSRLMVVTSPYHTRRALAAFTQAFRGTAVQIGITPAVDPRKRFSNWWRSSYDRHYVLYEWAAIVKYRLQYGIPIL